MTKTKRVFAIVVSITTVFWAIGPVTAVPAQAASATVALYGCGSGMNEPCYHIEPQGEVVQASSGALPLFSFNLEKSSGSPTLNSVTVNLVDSQGTPTTAAADIGSLAVYKRTSWTGWGEYTFPAGDKVGELTTINAFSAGTSAGNIIDVSPDDAVSADRWAVEYYVVMTTSANWSGTDQVTYTMAADWVTVSDGTLGSAFTGQPSGDNYYAAAPSGWVGESFAVEMVDYMGTDASNNHEVEVRFTNDVNETSAETLTNYNISATNPTAAVLISPMVVRLTFASSVAITSNQTGLTIDKDITSIGGTVLSATADPSMTIMGGGGGGGGGGAILISEVRIGDATSGLNEFVELYNPDTVNAFDLTATNLHVWIATGSSGSVTHTKIADLTTGNIAANGYYLIAADEYTGLSPSADSTYDGSAQNAVEGALRANSGVYISTNTSQNVGVVDRVGWGTATGEMSYGMPKCTTSDPEACTVANDGKSLERKANYSSTAATMASGGADVANGNSYMTHDNQYDFIQRIASDPQSTASTAETPGGAGYGATNNYPFINHEPILSAPATQDLVVMAEVNDDSGQLAASNIKLYYRTSSPAGSWSSASATQTTTGSSWYRFTIPSSNLNASQDLDYYLRAYDGTNYTCMPPGTSGASSSCDPSTNLIASSSSPWTIDVTASGGSGVISGTVQNASGNSIPGVIVYTQGMPYTVTTDTSGSFSFRNLPDGVYDIVAQGGSYTVSGATANYLEGGVYGLYLTSANQTSTGNTITLIQGVVENRGGTSADSENPWVMWSAPHDMMMGHPMADDLIVVFDKAMQSSTITGGSALTDNIYLVDSAGSIVAGTVTYYADTTGRPSTLPTDSYLMTYNPTSDLTPGSSYMLVVGDTVLSQNGKRLMGNRSSGFGQNIGFTAAMDYGSGGTGGTSAGYSFGSGESYPPYVIGSTPGSGGYDVALNTKINITFSEAMSSASVNSTNITMYTVANPYTASEVETAFTGYVVSQNTAGDTAILTPSSNLSASTHYRVKVLSNVSSADGTPMSTADNGEQFRIDFDTGSSTDSSAPTVAGVYPGNNATSIPSNLPAVSIGFAEAMDSSTINSTTVKLKRGTTSVSATVEYNIGDQTAYLMPNNALRPGAEYTIQVATGVTDIVGNVLAATYESTFTTDSTIDTTSPTIEYARCDDYSCSVTFSEPMNSARVGESGYTNGYSVLKPSNYAITGADFSSARAEYDQMNNTVVLDNVSGLTISASYTITVSNVTDKAGNAIGSPNSFSGTVENSMGTGGMMGPGGPGPMMGPATMMDSGGNNFGDAGFAATGTMTAGMGGGMGYDFGGAWEKPTNVMPMNMMAGASTTYFVEFSPSTAIPSGGTIKLTFPTGTDVSSAAAVATTHSMANKDINGSMDSATVTIASVSNNAVARTVTITTSGAIAANDMVMFDLSGISNPTVPKSYDSNGYTVDIKTRNDSGALLDSMTSFPFYINQAGDYTLSGTITAAGATSGTATVYLGSWMTGPMEATATFSSGTASYSLTGLSEGDYHLHTEPSITLNSIEFNGYMQPESIFINSSACTSNICTKNFSFTRADSGATLTVQIYGDFSSLSATDRNIDIWAGSYNGHVMKTVTIPASDYSSTAYSATLYLNALGEWHIGMGPAMPKGTMMMGPPPMPSWIPPQDIEVTVSGSLASPTWAEQSNTADDGTIDFTITSATNQIIGYVIDGSGSGIANVDVDAHRTQGGFGMPAFARTDTDGRFVVKVATGTYEVNAWMPGLPWSPGRVVEVQANSSNTDGNTTADVYKDNGSTLITDSARLQLKLNKSSTTISGKLLDNNGDTVAYAPVWAYSQSTGEHMPSGTDASGNYTIYVGNGNWYVEAYIPGIGDVSYANNPVSVSGSNKSDINIRPSSSTTFYTISGTVTISGSTVSNASVWVDRGNYHNGTNTNSSGEYRLKVPANSGYSLKVWAPNYGELDPVTVNVAADVTQNFTVAASSMHTLTINFTNQSGLESGTEAFIDIFDPSAMKGNHKRIDDLGNASTTSTTMSVKAGTNYEIHMYVPGIGGMEPTCADGANITCSAGPGDASDTWGISGDAAVTFTLPDTSNMYTFTVTVNNASSSTALADAFVWLGSSSFHVGEPTNSLGVATLKVPAGTYNLGADKPGYTSPASTSVTLSADANQTINLTSNPYILSGTITNPSAAAVSKAWVWADQVTSATDLSFSGGWTGTEVNSDGTYELSISDGFWLVRAVSDAYKETVYTDSSGNRAAIQINGASVTGADITLAARSNYTAIQPKSSSITPASGGTIDDTGANGTGVKLVIPPSALGTGTSAGTVNIADTYSVPATASIKPLGGKGKEISATNSSGQSITNLSGSANIKINYSESNIPSGVSESELLLAYFDDSSNQWVEIPATIDQTNNTISGSTTHFSQYIVGSSADIGGPTQPGTPTATTTAGSVALSWTAATDAETSVDGYQILRSTDNSSFSTINSTDPWSTGSYVSSSLNSGLTYTDTSISSGGTYYYYVVAFDTAGNHSVASGTLTVTAATAGGGGAVSGPPAPTPTPDPEPEPESEPEVQTQDIEALKAELRSQITDLKAQLIVLIKELMVMILQQITDLQQELLDN